MSLINDALKKAQRERSGGAPQPLHSSTANPVQPAAVGRPQARPAVNLWPIAIAAVALVGGGAAVWILKPTGAPITVAANVPPPISPGAAAPIQEPPAPIAVPPAAEPAAPQLHINLPGTAPAVPAPAPVQAAPVQPAPAPVAAPVAAAPASAPAPFQVTLKLDDPQERRNDPTASVEDPRVLAFLDNARISGIRIAADDAKLLMNSKVYRTGDTVDRELGLKVTHSPRRIDFRGQAWYPIPQAALSRAPAISKRPNRKRSRSSGTEAVPLRR
ncbi:MAG: hypothetical protein IPL39_10715 [Opitutaceae bacterium]|nr:hypothetical protein [Opitutaceae bacterium]